MIFAILFYYFFIEDDERFNEGKNQLIKKVFSDSGYKQGWPLIPHL